MKNKKYCKLAMSVVLGMLAISTIFFASPAQAKVKFKTFDFEAHRGGRDARPENTLYSYAYALEQGATTIECDMQMTKDGYIVMSHNPILNPDLTRDASGHYVPAGKYDIRNLTLQELQKYDVGVMNPKAGEYYDLHGRTQVSHSTTLPRLEELFELIKSYEPNNIILNIETKSYPDPASPGYKYNPDPVVFVQEFNRIVKKYGMENRVMLESFDWQTLKLMKKLNPNITLSALWQEQPSWGRDSESLRSFEEETTPWLGGIHMKEHKGNPILAAHAIGADVVSCYYTELSKENVELAHELGMKVVPWTVNSVRDMNMLIDMGVDGMITDRPWVLRPLLLKRGYKLNKPIVNKQNPYHLTPDHYNVTDVKHKTGADAAI